MGSPSSEYDRLGDSGLMGDPDHTAARFPLWSPRFPRWAHTARFKAWPPWMRAPPGEPGTPDHEQLIHPVNHAHLAAWVAVVVVVPHISAVVHKMQRPSHRHISETHTGFNDSGEESDVDVDTNIVNNN